MLKGYVAVALAALAATAGAASAQDYPADPVTIIVPSSAGGSTDTTARIFKDVAENKFDGFEFVIRNIDGSGGQKGFEAIARADPDGYTIGMDFTPQLVAHIVSGRASYTLDDFHVMGNAGKDPELVVVPKESDISSLDDLAEAAKDNELTVAVNGIGSDDFLAAKNFEDAADVSFNLLPTDGSTQQKSNILGGHIDAAFMNLSQIIAQHKSGDAHIIAMLTDERSDRVPEVATGVEQGYDVKMRATRGFVAPAEVPDDILNKLDEVLEKTMADPAFTKKAEDSNIYLLPMSGPDYLSYLQDLQADTQKVYDAEPW